MKKTEPKQAVAAIKLPVKITHSAHGASRIWIDDADGALVCEPVTEDDARQIAHALNSLPGLLAAAKAVLSQMPAGAPYTVRLSRSVIDSLEATAAAAEKGMV